MVFGGRRGTAKITFISFGFSTHGLIIRSADKRRHRVLACCCRHGTQKASQSRHESRDVFGVFQSVPMSPL